MTVHVWLFVVVCIMAGLTAIGAFLGASERMAGKGAVLGFMWGLGLSWIFSVVVVAVHFITKFW